MQDDEWAFLDLNSGEPASCLFLGPPPGENPWAVGNDEYGNTAIYYKNGWESMLREQYIDDSYDS